MEKITTMIKNEKRSNTSHLSDVNRKVPTECYSYNINITLKEPIKILLNL